MILDYTFTALVFLTALFALMILGIAFSLYRHRKTARNMYPDTEQFIIRSLNLYTRLFYISFIGLVLVIAYYAFF